MIVITSFKESVNIRKYQSFIDANTYSVARFQPKHFDYIQLHFLSAKDVNGNRLRLTGENKFQTYKSKLLEYYKTQKSDIHNWLKSLRNDDKDLICCWCPYSNTTKNQMNVFGTFVCHTGIVGQLINVARPDIDVYMDEDHHKFLIDEYKPYNYKLL